MIQTISRSRIIFLSTLLFAVASVTFASATNGTIGPNDTLPCVEANVATNKCTALLIGEPSDPGDDTYINFGRYADSGVAAAANVTVTSTELTGYVFGEDIGWISLNCANEPVNNCASNGNFHVANNGSGVLSGYAWGENAGWINFGPFLNSATPQVKIDPTTGLFGGTSGTAGYAWSEIYGWIEFDCSAGGQTAGSCVETDWRQSSTTTSGGSVIGTTTTGPGTTTTGPGTTTIGPGTTTGPGTTGPGTTTDGTTGPGTTGPGTTTTGPGGTTTGTGTGSGTTGGSGSTGPLFPPIITAIVDVFDTFLTQARITLSEPIIDIVTKTVAATGALVGVGASLSGILAVNPIAVADFASLPLRLWSLLLAALGLKRKPWGTVYDAVTKQPLDPVYVTLKDSMGNDVGTSITDLDGRYGFTAKPGTYTITVGKTNYSFPSKLLAGKTADELYADLYFGEPITITAENQIIAKNVPMDPIKFDWNEFAKRDQKLMTFYTEKSKHFALFARILYYVGFTISSIALVSVPKPFNAIIFGLYVLIFLLRRTGFKPQSFGGIVDRTTGFVLPFAIIRIYSPVTNVEIAHKVTDDHGRYYCLVQNGTYYITVDKKNPDGSYTRVHTSEPFPVTTGFINKVFTV